MLHATLLTVGEPKAHFIRDGIAEYLTRLAPLARINVVAVKAGKTDEEHGRLLTRLEKTDDHIVVLDERGRHMTSVAFAGFLADLEHAGTHVTFVIGGAYGLDDVIRERADTLLSLSAMTLPHELAQLLFFEQLYRGLSIARGGKYHHE